MATLQLLYDHPLHLFGSPEEIPIGNYGPNLPPSCEGMLDFNNWP